MHDSTAQVHPRTSDSQRLGRALVITAAFMLAEAAGGLLSGSLALLADAGHMLTDAAALALAWLAARYAVHRGAGAGPVVVASRGQLLAALVNALALFGVAGWLLWEGVQRLLAPREIAAGTMLAVALLGLLANVAVLRVLGAGHGANLNLAAARLHVISDLLGSIAASAAAVVILATGWTPVDPLLSMLVALLIVRGAAGLLLESARAILRGPAQPGGGIGAGADPPA